MHLLNDDFVTERGPLVRTCANGSRLISSGKNSIILICFFSLILPVLQGCAAGKAAASLQSSGSTPGGGADKSSPTVAIISPNNGVTVSKTITVAVTASDPDSPVSFVQIQVDGSNVSPQLTTAPYSFALDTTKLPNGSQRLTAIAVDPAGNTGNSAKYFAQL